MSFNPILRLSGSNQSLNNNLESDPVGSSSPSKNYYAQLRARLIKDFPNKYFILHSLFVGLVCASMIVAERMQPDNFTWVDFYIISYRTLDGLILVSCLVNVFYAVLALFTGNIFIVVFEKCMEFNSVRDT
jgi:hypothetical protein